MIEAGYYNTDWAKFYFPADLLVLALVSGLVLLGDMTFTTKLIVVIFSLIGVIVVPDTVLQMRRKMLNFSSTAVFARHDVGMCSNRYDD